MSHSESTPATANTTNRDPRTHRACTETMTTRALLDGDYEVRSQSGWIYQVNPIEDTCDCPDPHTNICKHLRRVKLEIAVGELPHPDDCPTDAELAAREPPRSLSPPQPAPATAAIVDGGQTVETAPDTETDTTAAAICRAISDRIRDLEQEIDCYQAELHDLQTALSVIEDVTEQPHLPEPASTSTTPAETAVTRASSE